MKKGLTVLVVLAVLSVLHTTLLRADQPQNSRTDTSVTAVQELAPETGQALGSGALSALQEFYGYTGFANARIGNIIMIIVGLFFIWLAVKYGYEPLLLIPIGTGILLGNIPFKLDAHLQIGIYEPGSVLNYLYYGVVKGIYPPLIFLGIGAMTDFSSLISNPRLLLLGAAAQVGIFATFIGALMLGFHPAEAGAIGIIGGADGPTAIFLSSRLANGVNIIGYDAAGAAIYVKNLIGPIAIAAYS